MNDDAFARRFYADRAELDSLGIELQVEKPGEDSSRPSSTPCRALLPAGDRVQRRRAGGFMTALSLLTDGGFAYAEPLRLALQQVAWGHPQPDHRGRAGTGGEDGNDPLGWRTRPLPAALQDRDRDLARRRSSSPTTRWSATRPRLARSTHTTSSTGAASSTSLYAHERDAVRVSPLPHRGKVGYASKAEHDFAPPEDFDRRDYARRADWQMGRSRARPGSSCATASPGWSSATSASTVRFVPPARTLLRAEARSSRPITPPAAS